MIYETRMCEKDDTIMSTPARRRLGPPYHVVTSRQSHNENTFHPTTLFCSKITCTHSQIQPACSYSAVLLSWLSSNIHHNDFSSSRVYTLHTNCTWLILLTVSPNTLNLRNFDTPHNMWIETGLETEYEFRRVVFTWKKREKVCMSIKATTSFLHSWLNTFSLLSPKVLLESVAGWNHVIRNRTGIHTT
jgi:hypothetical protein